jgi:YbbR domain-containing protein
VKQNTKIILIIIMSIFLAVILTVQNTSKNNIQSDTIKRPNYKEGSQSLELDVYTQGNDKPSTIEFEVSPRQYTKDEAMQAFDEIYILPMTF